MTGARSVLVLGARADQLPVIVAARRRGLTVAAVDPDPDAVGLSLADRSLVADLADRETVGAFARSVDPAGILTFAADYPVPLVAVLAAELGLPGLPVPSVPALTDKLTMRERLSAAGVAVPAWRLVENQAEAAEALADLGRAADAGAVVIKPRRSSGSRGVTAVPIGGTDALHRAVVEADRYDDANGVLVEELVEGPEISVETVTVGGATTVIAITDKVTTGAPAFVEVGHSQPSAQADEQRASVTATTTAAIAAVGLDDGIGHVELRLTERGPVVIEVAGRAGGGAITADLVPLSTGVDMAELAIDLAIGHDPEPAPTDRGGAAVAYLGARPGTVTAVNGLDRASSSAGVHRIDCWVVVGDEVSELRDARQRIGRVIATGTDAAQARDRATAAAAAIMVETDGTAGATPPTAETRPNDAAAMEVTS